MKIVGDWRTMALRMACYAAPLIFVGCLLLPVRNRFIDVLILGTLAASLAGWIIRSRSIVRVILIAVTLIPVGMLCLPSRHDVNAKEMASVYAQSLQRYAGTRYWWGGETSLGIDCSGLVRAGMMDACLREGIRTLDGGLFRHALDLWWHDQSARALGEGDRDLTIPIGPAHSLNELDLSTARTGDLAIAGDGVHVLAYLGEKRWIQADPDAGKVIIETVPSKNPWMSGP